MPEKPKLAIYWAASCGGCEIAVVNLHEKLLDVDAAFEFMFCPCLLDTKKKDIEALPDKSIAITLFNGAIRTGENEEMAQILRKKSQLLIAFGSCACEGCIPGLANLHSKKDIFKAVYLDNPTIDNPDGTVPSISNEVPEGTLTIPAFHEKVKTLGQVTEVDYFIPGCPPESHQIWNIVAAVVSGAQLPPLGSVIGGGCISVCDECERVKADKKIERFYRNFEITPEPEKCLLEQGLLCMGIATRDGCGAPCPQANMPCTGCYGPPEGVTDQGARMIAALGSILDIGDSKGKSEEEIAARVEALLDRIPDYAGTFYKYSLPGSIIGGKVDK
ncbi:hypothetical protein KI809_13295 [Geobacter pelophilus]|uniref:NADH:ubiquinone oxidoreductase-like 20kDa subunit domain-containing protein n=1 Tax=Geoanaerobacter pelophilus TaxID=60036 RepID=A0AAW4LDQ7_9BACT|nr:hypothetical protein [Geoanaerobacter pelophilus]MBT0665276.1 hypothetical protein [Geoanaerobacter pelophilus]